MQHYSRAYVDRDAMKDGAPIRFVAATEGRKADNIDLRMTGARLDRYRSNPVLGYGHRYFSRDDLPIGRSVLTDVDGTRLLIDVEFDPADDFAQKVERKYRDGYLNAVSVGFDVVRWEGGNGSYWSGGVAEEWELTEVSAVPVPMDALAVVQSGRAGPGESGDRAWLRALVEEFGLERVAAALSLPLSREPEGKAPVVEQPAPALGVGEESRVLLLAAFEI